MEKNKGKVKINDELLDQVSGGYGPNPFGNVEIRSLLHCPLCNWIDSNYCYQAGDICPICLQGQLCS